MQYYHDEDFSKPLCRACIARRERNDAAAIDLNGLVRKWAALGITPKELRDIVMLEMKAWEGREDEENKREEKEADEAWGGGTSRLVA